MAIKLFTDSCSDMPIKMVKEYGISVIPLMYNLDGVEYFDDFGKSLSITDFYQKVKLGIMPSTGLINTQRYLDAFSKELEAGHDILNLSFSSALSGSFQSSVIAVKELKEKYPDRQIATLDSKCASFGEGLFVYYVANKLKENISFEDLYAYADKLAPTICHFFTVDDLNHLRRGGRVSGVSAAVGSALSIKPVLQVDDEGRLIPVSKQRGRKKALREMVNLMQVRVEADSDQVVFISHGDCLDDAKLVGSMVKEVFSEITEIVYSYVGPVIGSHAGPGTIALFFVGNKR